MEPGRRAHRKVSKAEGMHSKRFRYQLLERRLAAEGTAVATAWRPIGCGTDRSAARVSGICWIYMSGAILDAAIADLASQGPGERGLSEPQARLGDPQCEDATPALAAEVEAHERNDAHPQRPVHSFEFSNLARALEELHAWDQLAEAAQVFLNTVVIRSLWPGAKRRRMSMKPEQVDPKGGL